MCANGGGLTLQAESALRGELTLDPQEARVPCRADLIGRRAHVAPFVLWLHVVDPANQPEYTWSVTTIREASPMF